MIVSLDIETECTVDGCVDKNCKHALLPHKSKITVVAVVSEVEERTFIRLDDLKDYLDSIQDLKLVGQNFKFDLLHLSYHGLDINPSYWYDDTQLMAYVLTEKIPDSWLLDYEIKRSVAGKHHRKGSKHSLKTLAPYFLGVAPFWEVANKNDADYALKDARYTLQLRLLLERKLIAAHQYDFYKYKQLPMAKLLLKAEKRGIGLDNVKLDQMEGDLQKELVCVEEQLNACWVLDHIYFYEQQQSLIKEKYLKKYSDRYKVAISQVDKLNSHYKKLLEKALNKISTMINYDSPNQILELFKNRGYDVKSLDDDEDSTGRAVLERLADSGKEDIKLFLRRRSIKKLLTAFLPVYRDLQKDGRLYPLFNVANTRTGRTSSDNPNMQQVPPKLRPLTIPRPGYKFISYDADGIEANLINLYSNDPALHELLKSGISVHDFHTKLFFDLQEDVREIKDKYPVHRQATKNVGFALFYNAGRNRIRITFAQKGFMLTDGQCSIILNKFRNLYTKSFEFSRKIIGLLERGQVINNLLGRPISIENSEDAYMKAFNKLVQSSASDLNLWAAVLAQDEFEKQGIDAHVALFVHDSILVEVKENDVDRAEEILVDKMTNFSLNNNNGEIKLTVSGGVMNCWEK